MLPNYYKVCLISTILSNVALPKALPNGSKYSFTHYPHANKRKGDRRVLKGSMYRGRVQPLGGSLMSAAYTIVVDVDEDGDILLHVEVFEERPIGVTLKLGPINEAVAKLLERGALFKLLGNSRAFSDRVNSYVQLAIEAARDMGSKDFPGISEDFLIKSADYLYHERPLEGNPYRKGLHIPIFKAHACAQRADFLAPMNAKSIQDLEPKEVRVHPANAEDLSELLFKGVDGVMLPTNPMDIGKVLGIIPGHRFRWDNTLTPDYITVID